MKIIFHPGWIFCENDLFQGGGEDRDANDARRPIFKLRFPLLLILVLLLLLLTCFAHLQLFPLFPNPVLCPEEVPLLKIYIYFATKKNIYSLNQMTICS